MKENRGRKLKPPIIWISGEAYYEAQKAQEELSMTYSGLRNQVIAGNIQTIIPVGRRQAVYRKKDVDQLKKEMSDYFIARQFASIPSAKFAKATFDDVKGIVDLSTAIFGGHDIIPVERRVEWMGKNPDIFYTLKCEDQLMGYASFMPLKPERVEKILNDEETPNLTSDDIEIFMPDKPIDIYVMAVGVRPGISREEKRHYGSRLISGLLDTFINLGKRGITINRFVSRSSKPEGIRIMRHMGFTEIPSKVPGRRVFVIQVAGSGIPYIQQYKAALQETILARKEHSLDALASHKVNHPTSPMF